MYKTNLAYKSGGASQYLLKEILDATPQQLILKIYDFAIVNCHKKNLPKTNQAIQELINSLRFEDENSKDISIGLLRLYQFCQEQTRKNNFELVLKILSELRDSWIKAFQN